MKIDLIIYYIHNTFKIGGPAKIFIRHNNINKIIEIINLSNKYKIPFLYQDMEVIYQKEMMDGYYGVAKQINENNFSNLEIKELNENNYIVSVGVGISMITLSIEAWFHSLNSLEDIIDIHGMSVKE